MYRIRAYEFTLGGVMTLTYRLLTMAAIVLWAVVFVEIGMLIDVKGM